MTRSGENLARAKVARSRWCLYGLAGMLLILLAGCAASPAGSQEHSPSAGRRVAHVRCVESGGLPDPRCTLGAVRSGVSLAAICAFGYSRSVRPPESYTEPLKLRQMRAYGLTGPPSGYEEDHLVPLSIGGAPRDPCNLWPEPRTGAHNAEQKDRLETWLSEVVCRRLLPLKSAQVMIAKDWIAALHWVERHYPWVVSG
jgi:hypothetical protein